MTLLGGTLTVVVALQVQPVQEVRFTLDTVHVTVASRAAQALAAAARTIEVIDRQDIARAPVRSVQQLLARVAGADVLERSPASADIALRGSSFEQVIVLVDGTPVSDDQTGHFDLDLAVPLEAIERIEILRGAGSALYGPDAIGGVINIVTADGGARSRLRVEGGTFGTTALDADGGATLGSAALRGGFGWAESDGHRTGTDYRSRLARASLDVPVADGQLVADLGYGARDFGAADFYGPFESYEETRALTASVAWSGAAASRVRVAPRISFRRHHDHFILRRSDPAFYENVHTNWRVSGELVTHWSVGPSVDLAIGSNADRSSLRSARLGDLDETRAAGFLELVARRDETLVVSAGLRTDWHSAWGSFLSPSLAAMVQPAPALRLRASVDRGFRAPTWTERFYMDPANIGNEDLRPERFWSAEAGLTVAGRSASLDVVAFLRHAGRLIDWVKPADAPAGTPWQTTNIEDARFRGLEMKAEIEDVLAADWTVRATALSFDDVEADGFESKYALRPLTRTLSLEADFDLPHGLALWGRIASALRAPSNAAGSAFQTEPWTLGDVRLSWTRSRVTVFADALNVGDANYLDVSVRPAPGRALHVGMRIE